ncbi:MAG: ATP-binding protein [Ruminococcaceae bacterium]|nr:ATP-binding protein [Oscillospiraceae bacterium]
MANNVERARAIIASRREAAEKDAERKRLELETVSPELKEVNEKIKKSGIDAFRAVMLGNKGTEIIENLKNQSIALKAQRIEILKSFGLPEDTLEIHYTCPECEDTGEKGNYYCECFKSLVKQLQLENLCSCAPAKESTFANFSLDFYNGFIDETTGANARERMSQIYNYCKNWAEDFSKDSPSILMYGNTGLGKTHLSLAIANVVVEKGYNVIYSSAGNLFSKLEKEKFGKINFDESPEEQVLTVDLLILDDLGSEFSTQFTIATVYNIINTRILSGLPTIINTNLLYDEIGDKYNPRVYSRLIGDYQMLEFIGADIRQLKAD